MENKKTHAEKWAEGILDSEDGKSLQVKLEKEFVEYVVFGKTPYYGDQDLFEDFGQQCTEEYNMSTEEIIDKFDDVLTEKEKENLKNYI